MTVFLNGLWQGIMLAMAMWGVMKAVPGFNAATRHLLWWMALAAVLILPFAGMVRGRAAGTAPVSVSAGAVAARAPAMTPMPEGNVKTENGAGVEMPMKAAVANHRSWEPIQVKSRIVWWVIGGIWAVLSAGLTIRLLMSYHWVRRIRAEATEAPARLQSRLRELQRNAGAGRGAVLRISGEVAAPMVLGLVRPAIVLPAALAESILETDFDHMALHELAHLVRYDDWTNLLHRVVEILLPIQPAVIWIGRQIGLEREVACDDWVVGVMGGAGQAKPYAAALTRVAELTMWSRSGVLASGAIGRPSQLYRRVARLVGRRRFVAPRVSYVLAGLGIAAVVMLLMVALHAPQVIAATEVEPGAAATLPAAKPEAPGAPSGGGESRWNGPLEFEQSQTFTVKPGEKLAVDVDRGNVHVTTWDQNRVDIVVKYKGRTNDELKQFLEHHTVTMTQDPGIVRLTAKGDAELAKAFWQVETEYDVQVPEKFDAGVKDGMGNVDVTGLTGKLDANTGMGNVAADENHGTVTGHSGAGNVDAGQSAGTLIISTGTGNLGITQFDGEWVKADSAMGNVTADLPTAPKGDCTLQTAMGNVSVKLAKTAGINMRASTAMGNVDSQFAQGANNGGGPLVNVQTKMGNVRVEKE